jgi:hypothetical protein
MGFPILIGRHVNSFSRFKLYGEDVIEASVVAFIWS